MHSFDLSINEISKIEGKASLNVTVKDDKVEKLEFAITEYKRFYTKALINKDILAVPSLSSRICGTCSNAHLLCAIKAIENAFGIIPSGQTMALRRLLNYGLIIRDHALHLYVFSLPDIFHLDNILDLDEKDPIQHQILDDLFLVKEAGNTLSKIIGGRSVHAPYPTVGGFSKLPDKSMFYPLIKKLTEVRPCVLRLIKIFQDCGFYQEIQGDFSALMDSNYTFLEGTVIQSTGMVIPEREFKEYLDQIVIPYSQATAYKFMGKNYIVGALARMNLAKDKLHPRTQSDCQMILSVFPSFNLYHNNLAQAIEILHAVDSSIEILEKLDIKPEEQYGIERKESVGIALIEAPRGTLIYKLQIGSEGRIKQAEIIVPTGQNQILIEKTILNFLQKNLDKEKDYLTGEIEKIVRAFDPCMSCASHFLKVKWVER